MKKITTTKTHSSGIALGGIGTGSVELLPDGEFHFWQIANPPRLTKICFEDKVDDGEGSAGALSFWVREKRGTDAPIVRKLGMKTDPDDFTYRMFAWNKPVERIDFDGKFPLCKLDYIDSALSCKLSLQAVSPFVPHNSDIAATPGFYMDFTAENPTDETLEISLVGALEPNFANKDEGNKNSLHPVDTGYAVHIEPAQKSDAANCGDVCLSVSGDGEKTYITADHFRFMKEYVAGYDFGVTQESFLFNFRENGTLPDTKAGTKPDRSPVDFDSVAEEHLDALCTEYTRYPFGISIFERIKYCKPDFLSTRQDKIDFLKYCHKQFERMGEAFGSCALCSKLTLAPKEKKTVRFVLSWYFPNLLNGDGEKLGHYYENLYESSLAANTFLLKNSSIYERATEFAQLLYSTDMPTVYPDSWSSNLSPIIKSSAYLKNGKFGLWEGLGYCGFHTTDITYHASFGLINLFPDLQKKQMMLGAEFQRDDGRVHHCFKPDFEHVDDSYDRVDMNIQFVLMVLRDYLFTGDRQYLLSLWENVQKAMDSIEKIDTDGDGLPDYETKRNTYDAWNFSGASAYISILWLAALKAAVVIAEKADDNSRREYWSALLEKGKKSLEEKLWNGEYYNLWVDGEQTDESLMTDQLDGEWFLRMIGLDGNLPDERIREVTQLIFRTNFDKEQGLVNATVPKGKKTTIHTYKNCQTAAVWTGIGYAFAALSLSVGMQETAATIVNSIHANQLRFGYFWDHWECGHHYTRPMSSWSTLLAASGIRIDHENKKLSFAPIAENITFPLIIPDVLAKVAVVDGKCSIEYIQGNLNGWEVSVE